MAQKLYHQERRGAPQQHLLENVCCVLLKCLKILMASSNIKVLPKRIGNILGTKVLEIPFAILF